jgi:hypothetical protein
LHEQTTTIVLEISLGVKAEGIGAEREGDFGIRFEFLL